MFSVSYRFIVAVLFCATVLSAAKKNKTVDKESAPSPEAARVAILLYDDKTKTQNFEYMPGSLKEAITQSMHEKFEFNEVDTTKIDAIIAPIKSKSKGVLGPQEAAEICRKANVDILIYGDFTFSEANNKIEIHTHISLGSSDKFKQLPAVENPVDATIFKAADNVATDIVAEITKVAKEQQQAKDSAAEKEGKTTLAKTDKTKSWADTNYMVSAGLGVQIPLVSTDKVGIEIYPSANLTADYRFTGAWHLGVALSYVGLGTRTRSQASLHTNLEYAVVALTFGYFVDFAPRWRWTNRLGVGYFSGEFHIYQQNCEQNCISIPDNIKDQKVKNPAFIAQSGIHFLIFSYLSVGFEARWQMLYDQTPLQAAGGVLTVTTMF